MFLCCVESLSWFRLKLDFLRILKVTQKFGQSPCTIVQGLWPNFIKNEKERILHFYYISWYMYLYLYYFCKFPSGKFRRAAIEQNIHTRIYDLIRDKPTHSVLVESSIELLIIFAQLGQYSISYIFYWLISSYMYIFLDEKVHTVFNEAGIFRELIAILDRNMGESISLLLYITILYNFMQALHTSLWC